MTSTKKIRVQALNFSYQKRVILKDISAEFAENSITAIIGPSGAGKSTFLMTLNRLWENVAGAEMRGSVEIKLDGEVRDIYARSMSLTELRRRVAMVFQTPNPLPMSIYKNVAFPLKLAGENDKDIMRDKIVRALKTANLFDEVAHRMNEDARSLSGGQQQRLCIARALVLEPEVLLLDEPTSSLDRVSTECIEELLIGLKTRLTIIVVSHYLEQVQRISDTIVSFAGDPPTDKIISL